MSQLNDISLVAQVVVFRNTRAFDRLVGKYQSSVRRFFLHLTCGDSELSDDLAQDTFIKAYTNLASFKNLSSFSTWLYRLASNSCIDLLRRNKRTVDGISLDDEDVHLEVCDRAPTPEEHVEGRETQRLVREGLAALPEDYRRVLVLRELHQLSYAEICEVTELELGTVKSRINRARLLLRNYLAADGNFFEKPASKVTECNQTVGGERNAI